MTKNWKITKYLRPWIREKGPGVTYERACEYLREKGSAPITEQGFKNMMTRAFPDGVARREPDHVPPAGGYPPATPPESPPPATTAELRPSLAAPPTTPPLDGVIDHDKMLGFIKFTAAVESVGGIERAFAYLTLMDELRRRL